MIEIMDARELVSILKEKYGNCTHYKDRGRRISMRGGNKKEFEFTTQYYAPDRFHYHEKEAGKETLDIRFRKGLARTREEVEELSPLLESWTEKIPWILQRPYSSLKTNIKEAERIDRIDPTYQKLVMAKLYRGDKPLWVLLNLLFPRSTYADWTGIADIKLKEDKDGDEEYYILMISRNGIKLPSLRFPDSRLDLWIEKERLLISRIATKSHLFRHTIKFTGWLSLFTLDREEAQQLKIHNQKFLAEDSEADEICFLDHINLK